MPDFVKVTLTNGKTCFINKRHVLDLLPFDYNGENAMVINQTGDNDCSCLNPYKTPEEFVAKFESNNYEI